MIEIDGSIGEGGGQMLRSSLSLAMLTGQELRIFRIRAGRKKPGLLRQHLTCVQAAATVCGGEVVGAELGATELLFSPGPVRAGNYRFSIGSAGSASLVLQTVLPPLLEADAPSTVRVEGGTHNLAAPPFPFLEQVFAPRVGLEVELVRWGFFPAGGGEILARITPGRFPVDAVRRGTIQQVRAVVAVSGDTSLGERAAKIFRRAGLPTELRTPRSPSGFVAWVEAHCDGGVEVISGFGERRVEPEAIAKGVLAELDAWRAAGHLVGEHLADQLLLPMARFGGRMRTGPLSGHARTNLALIERFLPVRFQVTEAADGVDVAVG